MVAARIDLHVRRLGHVAFDTQGARRSGLVVMMRRSVVLAGRMLVARRTDLIAGVLQSRRMRIVAIAAANVVVVHLALDE